MILLALNFCIKLYSKSLLLRISRLHLKAFKEQACMIIIRAL